ncbi:MAG TPA: phage shock protein A [Ruminococcaceae bacterium]|nr:phage shock protein A [Oscillospiraceae bacterium]
MGIFGRFTKMTEAKINEKLDDIENPIEMCNQHLRDMQENFRKAQLSSAQVIGNAHQIENDLKEAKVESAEWDKKIQLAVSKGNDELAKRAIMRKHEIDERVQNLTSTYESAHQQAEKLKETLTELQDEINVTRRKRDELEARYKTAEASQKVNEIIANVSTKKNSINMDDLEKKVERKESMAEGLGELAEMKKDSLEDDFEKLENDSFDLDAELSKYKKSNP